MKDGHAINIWIVDGLNNRKILIRPQDSTYFYIPLLDPEGKVRTHSMEEEFKWLQAVQGSYIKSPDHAFGNLIRWHFTGLGCRQENGLNLCGERDETTSNTGTEGTRDTWRSDLGLIMSTIQKSDHINPPVRDIQSLTHITAVNDLRREEPDPKLFEVPAGYTQIPTPPQYLQPPTAPQGHPSSSRQ